MFVSSFYTKKERNKIYKRLLKTVCNDPRINTGMCVYLQHSIFFVSIRDLPELYKHAFNRKDEYTERFYKTGYYAPRTTKGWELRIKWILKAIEETN